MKIGIIGCGYVGLVSGVCMAALGHQVVAVDVDDNRIAKLNQGISPIYEPGLSELIVKEMANKRLRFTTDFKQMVKATDIIFIAVGTPPATTGGADLSMVFAAAEQVAGLAEAPKTLVIKSTVPPGTGSRVAAAVANAKFPIEVVNNPEFLREGTAINDFMEPDRVVFGANSPTGTAVLREIYQPLIDKGYAIFSMSRESAELTKFAANAMLAMRISFINELSQLAGAIGADIESVRIGIGSDKRIGPSFLKAGAGYGGSCFPKDVAALVFQMKQLGLEPALLSGIETANKYQKQHFSKTVYESVRGTTNPEVAVWGFAFKPDTDDIREAPAIEIIKTLLERNIKVRCYDPQAMANGKRVFGDQIIWAEDALACARAADAIAIVTEWPEFITQDWNEVAGVMRGRHIFDGRNCLASNKVTKAGLFYTAIGRQALKPGQGKEGSVGVVTAG
jgi:UDPglucose 6-dehydrogenase